MIKGLNKQMIVMKLEGNRLYDSACFVLKNEVLHTKEAKKDMLYEANRLLSEMEIPKAKKKRKFLKMLIFSLVLLIIGAIGGFVLSFFI